ncbi:unnamed protein product [Gordionus sp. m RMFG-2023]
MGDNAQYGDFPWVVNLRFLSRNGLLLFCSGSIINSYWILTAAHCFDVPFIKDELINDMKESAAKGMEKFYRKFRVYVGDYVTSRRDKNEVMHQVSQILLHSKYSVLRDKNISLDRIPESVREPLVNNDIALVKVSQVINFNRYVKPICVSFKNDTGIDDVFITEKICQIAGWGGTSTMEKSDVLQAAFIPFLSPRICENTYKTLFDKVQMICAGDVHEGPDVCAGDSGGPLSCLDNQSNKIFGIISWGGHCEMAKNQSLGVYTRVSQYTDWIISCMNQFSQRYCLDPLKFMNKNSNIGDSLIVTDTLPSNNLTPPPPTLVETSETMISESPLYVATPDNSMVTYKVSELYLKNPRQILNQRRCSCDWQIIEMSGDSNLQQHKCVSRRQKDKIWIDAKSSCQSREAQLLTLKSIEDIYSFVEKIDKSHFPVWLGLYYEGNVLNNKQNFHWVDGSPISDAIFSIIEAGTENERCFVLTVAKNAPTNVKFVIQAKSCQDIVPYICQIIENQGSIEFGDFLKPKTLKYCGSYTKHSLSYTNLSISSDRSVILQNDVLIDSFYAVIPHLINWNSAYYYDILEFDYAGVSAPNFLNQTFSSSILKENDGSDQQSLPSESYFQSGGLIIDPVYGENFVSTQTIKSFDKSASIINSFPIYGGQNGGKTLVLFSTSSYPYQITDIDIHMPSKQLYACNKASGQILVYDYFADQGEVLAKFSHIFGQKRQSINRDTNHLTKPANTEDTCDEFGAFAYQDNCMIHIMHDKLYVIDHCSAEYQFSRLQVYNSLQNTECSRDKYDKNVISAKYVDDGPIGLHVSKDRVFTSPVQSTSYSATINTVYILYWSQIHVYDHVTKHSSQNNLVLETLFQLVTKYSNPTLHFGHHGLTIWNNNLLAVYNNVRDQRKILVFDLLSS